MAAALFTTVVVIAAIVLALAGVGCGAVWYMADRAAIAAAESAAASAKDPNTPPPPPRPGFRHPAFVLGVAMIVVAMTLCFSGGYVLASL